MARFRSPSRSLLTCPNLVQLEARDCPTVGVQFDYRYDTTGYFTPQRKALLDRAAQTLGQQFTDSFTAITPGGGNSWTAVFDDGRSEDGPQLKVPNLTVPADTIVVFAFASTVTAASTLAFAGPSKAFEDLAGDTTFTTAVKSRGQSGILDAAGNELPNGQQTDTAMWGGTITFNANQTFNEDLSVADRSASRTSDFFDTAVHELGHVFGHVTSPAFYRFVSQPVDGKRVFSGPASVARFGGPIPVATGISSGSDGHYVDGTLDKDGKFNGLNVGDDAYTYRNVTSRLDIATFRDMGWQPATDTDGTVGTATVTNFATGGQGFLKADTIGTGLDADLYKFTATAGAVVPITTSKPTTGAAVDTYLRVFDAAGKQVAFDDNSGSDAGYAKLTFTAPAAGDYYVGVSSAPNTAYEPADAEPFLRAIAGGTGNYNLQIGEIIGIVPPPPAPPATAPTATATAPVVDGSYLGTTKYDFTVMYTATTAGAVIDATRLAAGNVTVTGPGGVVAPVTFVSASPSPGSASPLTATYRFTPPGGSWDPADNGSYAITLNAGQVRDTAGAFAAAGPLATVTANLGTTSPTADTTPPTATATAANVTGPAAGLQGDYKFTVTYSDAGAVNVESLGNANVRVTGPNGFNALAALAAVTPAGNGTVRVATYSINPPEGAFAAEDNGTYTIAVEANQVKDAAGNAAAAGTVGTFTVTVTDEPDPLATGEPEFVVGTDAGAAGTVAFYNADKSVKATATPFPNFTGGVRTAAADFDGDGVVDIVAATGPGTAGQVVILSGADAKTVLFSATPFEAAFTGGLFVAAGDLDGDGAPELVVTPDVGGGPRVRVYDGAQDFAVMADFFGIGDPNFRGGARAAIGDVNGDQAGDLIVAAGVGGGPRVAGFDGSSLAGGTPIKLFNDFFAFENTLRNGVYLAVGDVDGDGAADVIAGGGPGGGPRVTAFSGSVLMTSNAGTLTQVANFFGGDATTRGGIRVAVKNLDGDSQADIVVGAGTGSGSRVTAYLGKTVAATGQPTEQFAFDALAGFTGGVFVG